MASIENPKCDPVLGRGERMGRYGSMIPFFAVCLLFVVAGVVKTVTGAEISRTGYVWSILIPTAIGQVIVWLGMVDLRRCNGWDSGIVFYLWAGGFFTSLAICYAGIYWLALIPWVAPVVAGVARGRVGRRGGEG